jgi:hypothetical protein
MANEIVFRALAAADKEHTTEAKLVTFLRVLEQEMERNTEREPAAAKAA